MNQIISTLLWAGEMTDFGIYTTNDLIQPNGDFEILLFRPEFSFIPLKNNLTIFYSTRKGIAKGPLTFFGKKGDKLLYSGLIQYHFP